MRFLVGLTLLVVAASALAGAAPALWFRGPAGERVNLSQLSAQSPSGLVVCVLWCSHCVSCRGAEAELANLELGMRGRATVVAVDASIDDDPRSIRVYLNEHDRHFRVLQDPPGGLADQLNIKLTTTTVIFDSSGSIRYFGKLGAPQESAARAALEELLLGQPVTQPVTPPSGCAIRRPK